MAKTKIKILDIEIAVARFFGVRQNVIVPNISWGMGMHECDLFVLTKAGYGYEVEIKTSKADLKKDMEKSHGHRSSKMKFLYFALPKELAIYTEFIPERSGILAVEKIENNWGGKTVVSVQRKPKTNCKYCFTMEEQFNIARLGNMRTWGLRETLNTIRNNRTN